MATKRYWNKEATKLLVALVIGDLLQMKQLTIPTTGSQSASLIDVKQALKWLR